MARHRMLAPIKTIKHYSGITLATVTNGTVTLRNIANAAVASATGTATEVAEGSLVKAVHVELWIIGLGTAGQTSTFSLTIEKRPSASPAMTFTNSANLGAYPNKKNILYTTQGITTSAIGGSTPIATIRQWFAIPKGKQRMGLGDDIVLNLSNIGGIDYQICGMITFKEYQ